MDSFGLKERAQKLVPAIEERARLAEELRRVPPDTIQDFHDSELFRAIQPSRWGGMEGDPVDFFDAVLEVGGVCGSSAWVLSVVTVHSWQLGLFPLQAQEDVWGKDTSVLVSSSYAPTGTVERVDGGFLLSGTWHFSSGSDYCDWAFLGGVVPRLADAPSGAPDMRTFLVPKTDYTIVDNWYVAGLVGSGSKDIVLDKAFVPEHRTHSFHDVLALDSPGNAVNTSPLFRIPFGGMFCNAVAMPAMGIAKGMLRRVIEQSREKVAADTRGTADDPYLQLRIAEAAASVDGAYIQMRHNLGEMVELAESGEQPTLTRRARYRWDAARSTRISTEACDRLFEVSGGRSLFLDTPHQRSFRDVHAMRQHAYNNPDKAGQIYARAELGYPNKEFLL